MQYVKITKSASNSEVLYIQIVGYSNIDKCGQPVFFNQAMNCELNIYRILTAVINIIFMRAVILSSG